MIFLLLVISRNMGVAYKRNNNCIELIFTKQATLHKECQ